MINELVIQLLYSLIVSSLFLIIKNVVLLILQLIFSNNGIVFAKKSTKNTGLILEVRENC